MPIHTPGSVNSDPGQQHQHHQQQNTSSYFNNHLHDPTQAAAAEAAFFQTLSGMPDITPSAAAVNGWLTQARPERQLLDHFLAMPDGEFEGVALGWGAGSGGQQGAVGGSASATGDGGGGSGSGLFSGGGGAGFDDDTSLWYDLPGSVGQAGVGGSNGGQLPGFGGW